MPARTPGLNALTATENGELLDALLTARPALREQAEELAIRRLSRVDPVDLAVGILHGLHRCRDGGSESLIEYSPDYADERAAEVVRQCRAATVDLPLDDLAEVLTDWDFLFRRGAAGRLS